MLFDTPPQTFETLKTQPSACWLPTAALAQPPPARASPAAESAPAVNVASPASVASPPAVCVARSDECLRKLGNEIHLRVEMCGAVTNAGILGLAALRSVRHLELVWAGESEGGGRCEVDVEALGALGACPLESLHIECFVAEDLSGALERIVEEASSLRRLCVHESSCECEAVMAALGASPSLRQLEWHAYAVHGETRPRCLRPQPAPPPIHAYETLWPQPLF